MCFKQWFGGGGGGSILWHCYRHSSLGKWIKVNIILSIPGIVLDAHHYNGLLWGPETRPIVFWRPLQGGGGYRHWIPCPPLGRGGGADRVNHGLKCGQFWGVHWKGVTSGGLGTLSVGHQGYFCWTSGIFLLDFGDISVGLRGYFCWTSGIFLLDFGDISVGLRGYFCWSLETISVGLRGQFLSDFGDNFCQTSGTIFVGLRGQFLSDFGDNFCQTSGTISVRLRGQFLLDFGGNFCWTSGIILFLLNFGNISVRLLGYFCWTSGIISVGLLECFFWTSGIISDGHQE